MRNKGGRPRIPIDWPKVEAMCRIQCTREEVASILGISEDTLELAVKREYKTSFTSYSKQKGAGGKASLRRRQYIAAMDGNATLLIWLGKNWLGQKDSYEQIDENDNFRYVPNPSSVLPDDE